ncbi:MAG: hypothetical protein RMJ67_05640 [Elusimicrobiota bacterium]|nr:hypothetical protein [Endomicrobiia bacterium]MDW8165973.1 hypothetical protein [Elusimicrobiota bacterium]
MKIEIIDYKYKNYECIKFSNGVVDLLIPKKFGPRILYFGFKNQKNIFEEVEDVEFKNKYGVWKIYGGHRLWIAPESIETYYPDNDEVEIKSEAEGLVVSNCYKEIGIKKEITLKFKDKNKVELIHRIYNISKNTKEFSLWTLSVMCKNGVAVLPQNIKKSDKFGFLPTKNLVFWSYTDFKDKRLKITKDYIYIKQDPKIKRPLKIGQYLVSGWIGYKIDKYFFIKKLKSEIEPYPYVYYPDFTSNVEIYTSDKFLELEFVSKLYKIKKGEFGELKEEWELNRC